MACDLQVVLEHPSCLASIKLRPSTSSGLPLLTRESTDSQLPTTLETFNLFGFHSLERF
jgi:hypothetical protein